MVSVGRWERLQGEKAELECSFERQLRKLKDEQEKELQDLQERLREEQQKETELLQQQQSSQLKQLSSQHRQQVAWFFFLNTRSSPKLSPLSHKNMICQVEEMSESHEASMLEKEATHNATLATLQEEHARTVKSESSEKSNNY